MERRDLSFASCLVDYGIDQSIPPFFFTLLPFSEHRCCLE